MKTAVAFTAVPGKPAANTGTAVIENSMNKTDECILSRAHQMLDSDPLLASLTLQGDKLQPIAAACEAEQGHKPAMFEGGIKVAHLVP